MATMQNQVEQLFSNFAEAFMGARKPGADSISRSNIVHVTSFGARLCARQRQRPGGPA